MAGNSLLIWARALTVMGPLGVLAGCAAAAPSDSQQANLTNCTQHADAVYDQENLNGLARTGQNGLYFAPTPNHVFDAQREGSMDARANQIQDCMDNGDPDAQVPGAPALPKPQIITQPQQ